MVGTPHTNNYTLGRGEVSFSPFVANTQLPSGFKYLGNTPAFGLNVATTDLDHYNSDHGIKEKDNTITLEVNRTLTIECDDVSLDNLALFFFGSKTTHTSATATVTDEVHNNVVNDTTFQLGVDANNPAGVRGLASIVHVENDAGTPVVYVAGTDYVVDLEAGTIYLVKGGAIVTGTNLKVSYTKGTQSFDQVISGNTPIEGSVFFKSYNPVGNKIDYFIPWVKLEPDGDYNLKGDNWQSIKFKGTILVPSDGRAAIYANGRPYTP